MGKYYLAVDIGASSGRHILGSVENGKITLEEIYRFENGLVKKDGELCWDFEKLFHEIVNGMKRCSELGKIPCSMGIDTWGVDFVLLDEQDKVIGNTVAYRDARTQGMDTEVYKKIPQQELYRRTGIQKAIFNSIYQLYAIKLAHPDYLERAESWLMTPEYFNFLLTGVKKNEYTISTTTQLVNAESKTWDEELLRVLGIPPKMFGKVNPPKTTVGRLREQIQQQVGFDCEVVLPATHDTGSAVLAVPTNDDDCIYLSSGTWSLMGVERKIPDCSERSCEMDFTNEGGYDYRFRYLKNIMGLWMIQSAKRELKNKYTFDQLCDMAQKATGFTSIVDVNDNRFLAPESMIEAIKQYCADTKQQVPETIGEIFGCIYNSLAKSYHDTVEKIENITGRKYTKIHIVGGGSKDDYLNRLTAQYTGKRVFAGPTEATAIGNLLAQLLKDGVFASLEEARTAVAHSFNVKEIVL